MTTEELIKALREKPSRDNRALLDEAVERIEKFSKELDELAEEHSDLIVEKDELFDIAERQKAEIERLKATVDVAEKHVTPFFFMSAFDKHIEKAKADAVKEFAERLKQEMEDFARIDFNGSTYYGIGLHHIDSLVEEFTEGQE